MTQSAGVGNAIWVALALFLLAAIGFPLGMGYPFDSQMSIDQKLSLAQLVVSILGFGGAIVAFIFAFVQYRRSEQWKRAEFIAREMKEFESDPAVQNALLMIDWGIRKINLFLRPDPEDSDLVRVTREVQWRALLPHTIKRTHPEYRSTETLGGEAESKDEQKARFTLVEAKIRDTYDTFLTRLDRFASFIKSELISAGELEPFICYWVDAMTKNENPTEDAAWRCTLLTYINYYDYAGVAFLLECYGKDVSPNGKIYSELRNSVRDRVLAERLFESINPGQGPAAQRGSAP